MKKLLSLLSLLTISGSAVPTTIASSLYQKEKNIKNSEINYSQTNNLEKLNIVKRENNDKIENWYCFLCHNRLVAKISHDTWKFISNNYKTINNKKDFSNFVFEILNKFNKRKSSADTNESDYISSDDIKILYKVITDHFSEINETFKTKNNDNIGLIIKTNRDEYWLHKNHKDNDFYWGVSLNSNEKFDDKINAKNGQITKWVSIGVGAPIAATATIVTGGAAGLAATTTAVTAVTATTTAASAVITGSEIKKIIAKEPLSEIIKNTNLGVLFGNDDYTIINKLNEKNTNLKTTTGLKVFEKYNYDNKKNISAKIVASESSIYEKNSYIIVEYALQRDLNDTSYLINDWEIIYNKFLEDINKDIEDWLPKHINNKSDIYKWERDTNREMLNLLHDLKQDIEHIITNNYIKNLYSIILDLENDLRKLEKTVDELISKVNYSSKSRKLSSVSSVADKLKDIIDKKPKIGNFIPHSATFVPVVGKIFAGLSVINFLYCSLNKLFD